MKILIVLTSHGRLRNTGKSIGFGLEEFSTPYYGFNDPSAETR